MDQQERRDPDQAGTETTEETQRIIGGGDYEEPGEEEDIPPGGDVRTVYMQDREPGAPEPGAPQPS